MYFVIINQKSNYILCENIFCKNRPIASLHLHKILRQMIHGWMSDRIHIDYNRNFYLLFFFFVGSSKNKSWIFILVIFFCFQFLVLFLQNFSRVTVPSWRPWNMSFYLWGIRLLFYLSYISQNSLLKWFRSIARFSFINRFDALLASSSLISLSVHFLDLFGFFLFLLLQLLALLLTRRWLIILVK